MNRKCNATVENTDSRTHTPSQCIPSPNAPCLPNTGLQVLFSNAAPILVRQAPRKLLLG